MSCLGKTTKAEKEFTFTKHLGQEAGQAHDTSFLVNVKMLLSGKS